MFSVYAAGRGEQGGRLGSAEGDGDKAYAPAIGIGHPAAQEAAARELTQIRRAMEPTKA